MSYQIPAHRAAAIAELLEALRKAKRVVLTTHVNADGDGTGCEVALASWLGAQGKEAWILNPTPYPANFDFLLDDPARVLDATSSRAAEIAAEADFVLVVDTGEVKRIGRVKPLIGDIPLGVIDHHPVGDDPISGISFRDSAACAAGELVYDLILAAGGPWTDTIARGLYVAILTDTGSFRHSNTTAACHKIVAELIDKGVDPETIHSEVYGAVPLRRLHLLREALGELETDASGAVAWITVPQEAFEALKVEPEDIEGLVDYPRSLEGVDVGLLFRTLRDGATKVSFRSNGGVDVNAVAALFGGGGHVRASGAVIPEPIEIARTKVVEAVLEAMERNVKGPEAYSDT